MKDELTIRPRRLTVRLLCGFAGLFGALIGAMIVSVIIEWFGMTLFWSDQGASRSAAILEQDLSYLGFGESSRYEIMPVTAVWAVWIFSNLYQVLMVWTGLETLIVSFGATSYLLASYLQAAINTIQTYLVRLAITITALPLIVLFGVWGALEGTVRRDLRRFGGDIEHSMLYHWAKHVAGVVVLVPIMLYLAWPTSVNPAWVFVPFAFLLGINLMALTSNFTKYV
ncbi:MAG: TIGR03747 family integrating conjugative element membrane protein [Gammaproteobacteria bacterium]|nr:TIGR03747 family integrating conjugative element membrane protein [Gammaproteobacteria bacterium]MCY4275535.1 TIGR03747 family integrating conjugative element membrane protein [Gammaproteobacteria bacterium]